MVSAPWTDSRAMAKDQIWTPVNMDSCDFLRFVEFSGQWWVKGALDLSTKRVLPRHCSQSHSSWRRFSSWGKDSASYWSMPANTKGTPGLLFSTAPRALHIAGLATVSAVAWIFFVPFEIHVRVQCPWWGIKKIETQSGHGISMWGLWKAIKIRGDCQSPD